MAKQSVAVLFGGASKDHKLSLRSAYEILGGLARDKYEIIPIGITKAGRWLYFPGDYEKIRDGSWETDSDCCSAIISPDGLHRGIIKIMSDGSTTFQKVDVVFSALHGKFGECGRIQGLCKLAGIPIVDSDTQSSAICNDRMLTNLILKKYGVKIPKYYCIDRVDISELDSHIEIIENRMSYPMTVVATSCTSSIGENIVYNADDLKSAIKIAFSHNHMIIVEEFLSGNYVECAVVGNAYHIETSEIGEIVHEKTETKYANYQGRFTLDDTISLEITKKIKDISVKAFQILGCTGYTLVSLVVTENDVYCKRVLTIPGFSKQSAFPMLMGELGYSYPELLDKLIGLATGTY